MITTLEYVRMAILDAGGVIVRPSDIQDLLGLSKAQLKSSLTHLASTKEIERVRAADGTNCVRARDTMLDRRGLPESYEYRNPDTILYSLMVPMVKYTAGDVINLIKSNGNQAQRYTPNTVASVLRRIGGYTYPDGTRLVLSEKQKGGALYWRTEPPKMYENWPRPEPMVREPPRPKAKKMTSEDVVLEVFRAHPSEILTVEDILGITGYALSRSCIYNTLGNLVTRRVIDGRKIGTVRHFWYTGERFDERRDWRPLRHEKTVKPFESGQKPDFSRITFLK